MELLELDLGADIDARLQRWQVRRLECTRWLGSCVARGMHGYIVRAMVALHVKIADREPGGDHIQWLGPAGCVH